MQKFSDTIATTKPDGTIEVLPSATVTVYLAGTTTLASIYSTNTGTAKTNPFLSAAATGRIEFYAADGRYDLRVDKAGYATVSVLDVLLEDPDNIDDNLDDVTISNSTLSQCILLNSTVNDVDSLSFSDTPDALTPRRMAWNIDEGTLDVALDSNTTLQMGQELHYRARNNTASTIADGAVVWATGTTGATGRINVGLAVADGSQPGKTVMGLMTHATAAGSDGYVTNFGKVRGINTTGSAVGETWLNGDILYLHPTIPGALTKVKPAVNGNIVVTVAIVIYAGNNGTLFVRPTADSQEADEIRYTPAGTGTVATTVQAQLRNFFGGAIRNSGGTWSMIDDSGHRPIGISSVTQPDAYTYKINYTTPGSKVGTVLSITDFELAPYGPHTGASGATDSSTFCMYAPCVLYVNGRGSVSASPLWTSQTGPITAPDAASVQITHANRALAVDPPIVTPVVPAAGSLTRQYHVAWSATTTTITSLDDIQGYAYYDGAAWQLSLCPNLNVSISYSAGLLTVTHPDATGHYNAQVTGLNTNLRPEILSLGNTSFVIQWRDTAGAVVGPTATTGMKVLFRRSALVPSTMDAGVRFGVDLGLCKVANADVGNVSLNNFWIVGMNNP